MDSAYEYDLDALETTGASPANEDRCFTDEDLAECPGITVEELGKRFPSVRGEPRG